MINPQHDNIPFQPNPKRSSYERLLGGVLTLLALFLGGYSSGRALYLGFAIVLLVTALCLISVADARQYGPPPAVLSFRATSYPFFWLAYGVQKLFSRGKN